MAPEGAEPFKGKMNQDVTVAFEKPGVYGYQCKPHYAMGMVGLVVVGDPAVNLDAAKAAPQKGKARNRFQAAFAAIEARRLASK
jgi:pseudoazurin